LLLTAAQCRKAAGRRCPRWCLAIAACRRGLGGEPETIHQLHDRAPLVKILSRRPRLGSAGRTPASLDARSSIAAESGDNRPPLSGAPAFTALTAAASSRGIVNRGSLPMARTASFMP